MDILDKLDRVLVDTTVAGDVATNTGQGKIDVVGGKCPDGMVYDKTKKTCVPSMKTEGYIYVFNNKKNKRIRIPDEPDIIEKYKKKGYLPESSVVGGSYVSGTTSNIIGSGQTRAGFTTKRNIVDLARKEPVEDESDDPTETNILGRRALKFDKESGAYVPSIW